MTFAMIVVLGILNPFVVLFGLLAVYVARIFGLWWAAATVIAIAAISAAMVAKEIEPQDWPLVPFWFAVVSASVSLTASVISATSEFGKLRRKRPPETLSAR